MLGAAVANFAQLVSRKINDTSPPRSVIDYSMALAIQPASLAGTIVGVIFNALFPDWLILALLVVTLAVSVCGWLGSGVFFWWLGHADYGIAGVAFWEEGSRALSS